VRPGNHNVRLIFFSRPHDYGHLKLILSRAAQDSSSVPIGISHR
jgi:hypothetical protein